YPQGRTLFIRSYQQINKSDNQRSRHNRSDSKLSVHNQVSNLVNAQGHHISQAALITDGKPEPLRVVHLSLNCAHCGKAGSAQQVEYQEGVGAYHGKVSGQMVPNLRAVLGNLGEAVKNAEGSYYIFLCYQAGNRGNRCLPVSPAKRNEEPLNASPDSSQDTVAHILHRAEACIGKSIGRSKPDDDGGQQDNGSCLLNEGPASLPHASQHVSHGRHMVGGQLHNEGSRVAGEHLCLLQNNTGADDRCDSHKVSAGGNPGSSAKESACNQGNDGKLRAAGDKGGGHNGHFPVSVVLNGTGSHNAGNAAAGSNQHGDKGLTGQSELAENTVHDERHSGHVAAGLQERQE